MSEYDAVFMEIGGRDYLTRNDAVKSATAFRLARRRYPKATIAFSISGYDDDPRDLADIPEVAEYMRIWAPLAGLSDWRVAIEVPWEEGMGCLALLQLCSVFAEDSPIRVITQKVH